MAAQGPKRKRDHHVPGFPTNVSPPPPQSAVSRGLLEQAFPYLQTLREHILSKLPKSSRLRRKKIALITNQKASNEIERSVASVLDNTLVGLRQPQQTSAEPETADNRWEQFMGFSQRGDESYVSISDTRSAEQSLTEILEFSVWLLFKREKGKSSRPNHLLCHGFDAKPGPGGKSIQTIPDVYFRFPNSNFKTLEKAPWPQVLALLGQSGERLMVDLIFDHSIFLAVNAGHGNYYQLSGIPLFETLLLDHNLVIRQPLGSICRTPGEITLMRSRMLYAKPALTAGGFVETGFKHIHVLNRCPQVQLADKPASETLTSEAQRRNDANNTKVMMYIFPRQFGLHNAFTSEADKTRTTLKFADYTYREDEIASLPSAKTGKPIKIPKRLRGPVKELVQRLQVRHSRCSYFELLRYYCPSKWDALRPTHGSAHDLKPSLPHKVGSDRSGPKALPKARRTGPKSHSQLPPSEMPQFETLQELACPIGHVSAYCQAVMTRIIPDGFWGDGNTRLHNKKMFCSKVNHFVRLRRFETMSLHELAQDFKVVDIAWLCIPHLEGQKTSKTDIAKRYEIFHEFLYYVFDSLLMPLIRNNFYVTESNSHRNKLFYYRHDVWKRVTEPAMVMLRENMLEAVSLADATQILGSRRLGYSQLRLLPKKADVRPIMNLGKKMPGKGRSNTLGFSINSELRPIHHMLNLEKDTNASKLGSSMLSANEIYTRLKEFKGSLYGTRKPLYFSKIDVHAAFDTIPQDAVLRLMGSVPTQDHYTVAKHVELKPDPQVAGEGGKVAGKPIRSFQFSALKTSDPTSLIERVESKLGAKKVNTVFVDGASVRTYSAKGLLELLGEHVAQNIVKVGKRYYRQKKGIPQGSVVSSFLCNYFYADLEARHLGFLDSPDCVLLRFVDDFLLITQDKKKAVRFVETMHRGMPEYGVQVSPQKTLLNFSMETSDGVSLHTIVEGDKFSYCGTLIDCKTLEISRDHSKSATVGVSNSLTVEHGRLPGHSFEKKVLHAFRIQSKPMFYDTSHNSTKTVLDTLHHAFKETAKKMTAYIRCLAKQKRPKSQLIYRVIMKVIDVAFLLLAGKTRKLRLEEYSCDLRRGQVMRTGCRAFLEVLETKQTGYRDVILFLAKEKKVAS